MKVPGVEAVAWDWEEGVAHLRFSSGEGPDEDAIREAIEEGTRFSMGEIRYVQSVSGLPDALQ